MANILNVSGELSKEDLARYEEQLNRIAKMAGRTGEAANYKIQSSGSAGSASVNPKPDVSTLGDPAVCYAIYLAAIAAGVPEFIAAAAYAVCLRT